VNEKLLSTDKQRAGQPLHNVYYIIVVVVIVIIIIHHHHH